MNTTIIVWVLMTWGYGGSLNPSLEFKTKEKCIKVVNQIVAEKESRRTTIFGSPVQSFCVRIEK